MGKNPLPTLYSHKGLSGAVQLQKKDKNTFGKDKNSFREANKW